MPKVSVLLSEADGTRFSAYCHEKGHKKSTLIARLIREHLDNEGYAAQASLPLTDPQSETERRSARRRPNR
jgi:hypothetical protein